MLREVSHAPEILFGSTPEEDFFSCSHLSALKAARNSLKILCVSAEFPWVERLRSSSLRLVAQFASMEKLVLLLNYSQNLRSLAELKHLEELHIRVAGVTSLMEVLHSSSASLQHVTLAADTMDSRTYEALPVLARLRTLVISVHRLLTSSARILAKLQAPQSIRIIFITTWLVGNNTLAHCL